MQLLQRCSSSGYNATVAVLQSILVKFATLSSCIFNDYCNLQILLSLYLQSVPCQAAWRHRRCAEANSYENQNCIAS